jgi:predicted deacylase
LRADQGGILISSVELGDKVKKGDELGRVTDPVTNTGSTIIARESGRIIGMAVNQVVQTGFAVYHVGVAKEPKEVKKEALGIGDDKEQDAGLNDNDAKEQFEQE